jgi:beta-glucosidase
MFTDGPHGRRKQADGGDHLSLIHSDPATCFPLAVGLASSWDPDLVGRVGAALAIEACASQVAVLLGPGVDLKRSPSCGRNFEHVSEGPVLAGTLATAFVRAVQAAGVGTSLKRYAVDNQDSPHDDLADVDERTPARDLLARL